MVVAGMSQGRGASDRTVGGAPWEGLATIMNDASFTNPMENGSGIKRYMDAVELSAYLGISQWMIYKYIKKREIPFIPFGRLVRFDRIAVEKWAGKRMVRAGPTPLKSGSP